MSFKAKLGPTLCLVLLANGPKEKPVYLPVCDYLFAQGCTPIEVRSPGEALIHTRQAKFSLIIMPDDDHELIKKIKAPDGLNASTVIIAVSSAENVSASVQELLDHKVIQQVVRKTSSFEEFQKNLLEAVKCQLFSEGMDVKANEIVVTTGSQNTAQQLWNGSGTLQHNKAEQTEPSNSVAFSQSHQLYTSASQSEPCSVAASPYLPTNQSGEFLSSFPLQPFTLIHPMVVPYTSLLPGSSPYSIIPSEGYMMPRIVDFSPNRNQILPHLVGQPLTIPAFNAFQGAKSELVSGQSEPSMVNVQYATPDSTNDVTTTTGVTCDTAASNDSNGSEKLPGFQNFLECLCPGSKEDTKEDENETVYFGQSTDLGERLPKRTEIEGNQMQGASNRGNAKEEDGVDKNPLSVMQARPYFMNLDEQIEGMAFDPKVKASDRHNAKERHRRIRIAKAAEFFKEVLPCMHSGMDKAGAFHMTVYYILFLRNALRQIDPSLVDQLQKSYVEEWKTYFDSKTKIDKQTD